MQTQQAAFYDAQAQASRIAQALAHAKEMRELRERERDELVERRNALAKRIAEEADVDVVSSLFTGSLSADGDGGGTYIAMMRANVTAIVEALR